MLQIGFELHGQLQYKQKAQKILKISVIPIEIKKLGFPQGTYMAQNFIPKTATIFCSMTEEICKIYQLERK